MQLTCSLDSPVGIMLIITFISISLSPAHYFSNILQRTQYTHKLFLMISSKETSKILSPRDVAQYNLYGSLFALDLNLVMMYIAKSSYCYKEGSTANTRAQRNVTLWLSCLTCKLSLGWANFCYLNGSTMPYMHTTLL